MQVEIIKNRYGSLFAITEYSELLFQFEYRSTKNMGGPAWYFWPRGNYDPEIFHGRKYEFPMPYFKQLCRAKSFLVNSTNLDQDVTITKGEEHLGLK